MVITIKRGNVLSDFNSFWLRSYPWRFIVMKTIGNIRQLLIWALAVLAFTAQIGCMTVQRGSAVVQNTNTHQYTGKRIAALPVKTQAGIATDSTLSLRQEINKSLGQVATGKLPNSTVMDVAAVVNKLNQANLLSVYEQLVATYENTGVTDRKQIETLARGLGCDYLLFTRLKAEKMDIIISRGFGASIDAMLVDAHSGEVTWSGTGEWKRGGIYGFGETKLDEAARKLLELTFSSLVPGAEATVPAPRAPSPSVTKGEATASVPERTVPPSNATTVQQIQQRLADLGYQPGRADGKMGKSTVGALKKFQHDNNLPETGKADNETVTKLQRKEAKVQPSGSQSAQSTEPAQKSAPIKVRSVTDL